MRLLGWILRKNRTKAARASTGALSLFDDNDIEIPDDVAVSLDIDKAKRNAPDCGAFPVAKDAPPMMGAGEPMPSYYGGKDK